MRSVSCFFVLIVVVFSFCLLNAQTKPGLFALEGFDGEWFVDQETRTGDARPGEFLGRKAVLIKKGSHIIHRDMEFTDGTIEFDIAPMDEAQFIGIVFRRDSSQNYENVYLRPFASGQYEALQYAPRINGSATWQIYPEFMRQIDIPRKQWTHLRLEVKGRTLEIYVNKAAEPTLRIDRLRGEAGKGPVAFWGTVPRGGDAVSAALSNISIRPSEPVRASSDSPVETPPGTLVSWEVARPLENKEGPINAIPKLEGWKPAVAEESGLVNLSRAIGAQKSRSTGFARTVIKSDREKTVALEIGYSDDVTVFLNGEPVYSAVNGWDSRYPQFMGLLKPEYERVFLKLRPGDNQLLLAVTDDQRFGWGFNARIF
ncbi:MAG: hypothetical protein R2747_21010 [Pyrinomonadaceae bacterium]